MERTEEDKVVQAPIEVTLGGKVYEIPPLVIKYSRPWRKKLVALVAPLPAMASAEFETNDAEFQSLFTQLLVQMPDETINLFFEYARELDRKEIEDIATDAEMSIAFAEVVKVAFPLSESLPNALKHLTPRQ